MRDDLISSGGTVRLPQPQPDSDPAQPVKLRTPALDLLRGIAVLGILLVNIYSFALPEAVRVEPLLLPDYSAREQFFWYLIYFFADGKFIALLSLAFGASLWLFAVDKSALSPSRLDQLQWRRSLSLLVLGAAHAYLLWDGDVLVTYALFSLLVWRWRGWSDKRLIAAALCIFALETLLYGSMFLMPADSWQDISGMFDEQSLLQEVAHFQQGWWQQTPQRVSKAFEMQLAAVFGGWFPASMMLIGVVLARRGCFSGNFMVSSAGLWWLGFGAASFMLVVLLVNRAHGFASQFSLTLGMQLQILASGLMAIVYALLICRWARCGSRSRVGALLCAALIAVGRMALTIYIMQTFIFTGLFYGYGLGWYGQWSLSQLLVLIPVVWLCQAAFALYWLRYFHAGPIEAFWRWVIYRRVEPFRR